MNYIGLSILEALSCRQLSKWNGNSTGGRKEGMWVGTEQQIWP